MEQLYNAMVNYMQMPQDRPAVKNTTGDKDGFQKLLEQKQSAETASSSAPRQERPETPAKPQEAQETAAPQDAGETQEPQAVPVSEKELEERMSLAAMALLSNPLVADIAEETPQVLTDPSWEDGLVPVGYDDNEELGLRTVHWVRPLEGNGQNPEEMNAVASEWVEAENEAAAAPETQAEAPETKPEAPEMEIKVETGKAEAQDAETSGEEEDSQPQDAGVERPLFENVKAAPVKVGDAPAAEKAEKPVETQIGDRLVQALQDGETRVEIQLNPENLGKVKVEMIWSKDGGLVVQLHAENRETQSLLSKNLSGLENLLSRETQQEVRVEVPRQEESQRQDLYEQQQNQHRQQQQEQRQSRHTDSEAFLQQLRLGLIPMEED